MVNNEKNKMNEQNEQNEQNKKSGVYDAMIYVYDSIDMDYTHVFRRVRFLAESTNEKNLKDVLKEKKTQITNLIYKILEIYHTLEIEDYYVTVNFDETDDDPVEARKLLDTNGIKGLNILEWEDDEYFHVLTKYGFMKDKNYYD